MKILKHIIVVTLAVIALASCSSVKNIAVPTMDTAVNVPAKKGAISDEDFKHWAHADLATDSIPGMSLEKAYQFVEGKESKTVIVGVIDSGIDIEHEDLKDVLWVNTKEIAGNGIDDDKNGYVDDIYGWNFLGGDGVAAPEQLEITRLYAVAKNKYEGKTAEEIPAEEKADFELYEKYIKAYEASGKKHFEELNSYAQTINLIEGFKKYFGVNDISLETLQSVKTDSADLLHFIGWLTEIVENGFDLTEYNNEYLELLGRKHWDLSFDGRAIVGDNPEDITDVIYGNGNVIGSKDDESHGTHVSGIILATRDNGIGMQGVANNAKLMSVRAVPDGDERDKDVALAIRYAVDNGAKVINMSFGKSWSPNPEWVFEAFKYAEKNDVLLVHAAGNDGKNIDVSNNWPNDSPDKVTELVDNVLTVGAMSVKYDENMPATFTNYGQKNVDVFAPGVQIYSTVPKDEYEKLNGTSMASPEVAGVAALVRSYYPELTASQVKHIIMNSGTKIDMEVFVPKGKGEKEKFSTLSVSGRVLNAYNALVLADQIVNKK